jgi:hypothetical protein
MGIELNSSKQSKVTQRKGKKKKEKKRPLPHSKASRLLAGTDTLSQSLCSTRRQVPFSLADLDGLNIAGSAQSLAADLPGIALVVGE